jgi:hypothetical protein
MTRTPPRRAPAPAGALAPQAPLSKDSHLAAEIKRLVAGGERDAARERYGELVANQQRRAVRIAYQYLRDAHDADEAVQDAFVRSSRISPATAKIFRLKCGSRASW